MTPVSIGALAGILHDAPGDTAIVLCGAPGFEQLCAHRGWRELAESLAARGFPTLRFDWSGCGDSLGSETDPARLAAWEDDLARVVAYARALLSPRCLVLVGLRLGATIAARHAARAGDVDALGLLAPVVSGRAHARELAALAKVMAPSPPDAVANGLSVGGFRVTEETLAAIKALDLKSLDRAPAPRAILFAPDGALGVDETVAAWTALGCEARAHPFPGHAEWLAAPTLSVAPAEVFDRLADWIATACPPALATRSLAPPQPARLEARDFVETPMLFGDGGSLFGVLCEPRDAPRRDAVEIIVNAGANPHIGWARMNVEGARELAAAGLPSLRFDLAGLGDSPPVAGRGPRVMYDLATRADVSAAIDTLAARGYAHFRVIGLCSGAHTAFHAALADARIAGVVMANLQKFIWRDDYSFEVAVRQVYRSTGSYKRALFRADTWRRLLRGEIDASGIARELGRRTARWARTRVSRGGGESARVRRWFRALLDRGARVLLVYSVDDVGIDELALHFGAGAQPLRARGVAIATIDDADHNLTQQAARAAFFRLVAAFARGEAPALAPTRRTRDPAPAGRPNVADPV